jgi:cytochrome c2
MMKTYQPTTQTLKFLHTFLLILLVFPLYAQDGADLFKVNCAVCHTIGKGTLLGPDLGNVQLRRETDWIFNFIRSSQTLISNGDETAVALFEKFNKIQMPDQSALTDEDITALLAYIKSESPEYVAEVETTIAAADESSQEAEVVGKPIDDATDEDILQGRLLFSGERRLENGGPACLSCHNVTNDKLIGGGLLAKDLTEAFTRLNENGIKAMVSNPPFPAMRKAYNSKPISTDEAYLLTAFLKDADKEHYYQHARNYKTMFLAAGMITLIILLLSYTAYWRKRKATSVNQKIYDRQLSSQSYY